LIKRRIKIKTCENRKESESEDLIETVEKVKELRKPIY
jgi:hypothetical protein